MMAAGVEALSDLDVATVYEASGIDCALDAAIRPVWPGAKLCGPALPVRCHIGDNLAMHRALEHAEPGDVLVVQVDGHLAGYWGEVLAVAAQAAGVAGLLIDGGVRDIDAMQAMGFPVFSRGVGVFRTQKHHPGTIGEPVVVGGVPVQRGDAVLGDSDGALVLPRGELERVVGVANARRDAEAGYLERLRQGERTLDIYGLRERL